MKIGIIDSGIGGLDLLNKITPYLNKLDQKEIQKLTKEFELNIETYKINILIMNIFIYVIILMFHTELNQKKK